MYETLINFLFQNADQQDRATRLLMSGIIEYLEDSNNSVINMEKYEDELECNYPGLRVCHLMIRVQPKIRNFRAVFQQIIPSVLRNTSRVFHEISFINKLGEFLQPFGSDIVWKSIEVDFANKLICLSEHFTKNVRCVSQTRNDVTSGSRSPFGSPTRTTSSFASSGTRSADDSAVSSSDYPTSDSKYSTDRSYRSNHSDRSDRSDRSVRSSRHRVRSNPIRRFAPHKTSSKKVENICKVTDKILSNQVKEFLKSYAEDEEFEAFTMVLDDIPFISISLLNADKPLRDKFFKMPPPTPMKPSTRSTRNSYRSSRSKSLDRSLSDQASEVFVCDTFFLGDMSVALPALLNDDRGLKMSKSQTLPVQIFSIVQFRCGRVAPIPLPSVYIHI
ncbi:unnamed protein product [Caenorhabditis bovis]|uniref:Uncharacterized protein n=1 Tax=Caenorhabditis bovis TaxID=2654633 RepID=A0A8S1ER45_9PELO|nr:unnamed protein product [Caenorhabditis bovis]